MALSGTTLSGSADDKPRRAAGPLEMVGLDRLMALSAGEPRVVVGLIDGPVASDHPDLDASNIRGPVGGTPPACGRRDSAACGHGSFVAGILAGRRGSPALAICPGCTLMVRPVFLDGTAGGSSAMPSATPDALAAAITVGVNEGAHVLNLSVGVAGATAAGAREIATALDFARDRGVLVVTAAGNQRSVGGSILCSHPWVIPVTACDLRGVPSPESNLGLSIARRGLRAPGRDITSVAAAGGVMTASGTSFAAPLVTGALALLTSLLPGASPHELKSAVLHGRAGSTRTTLLPPLLDAWLTYQRLSANPRRR